MSPCSFDLFAPGARWPEWVGARNIILIQNEEMLQRPDGQGEGVKMSPDHLTFLKMLFQGQPVRVKGSQGIQKAPERFGVLSFSQGDSREGETVGWGVKIIILVI